jgi:hypothetical protein
MAIVNASSMSATTQIDQGKANAIQAAEMIMIIVVRTVNCKNSRAS